MSAVVFVGDAWKPSIVQIVPFADKNIQNSAKYKQSVSSGTDTNNRCFPVLAVTRSHSGISLNTVDTYSSLDFSDFQSEVSDAVSYSGRLPTTCVRKDKKFRKIARHSSMRENRSDMMVKFSVQDLNEQCGAVTPRRNSISSIDTGVSVSTVSASSSVSNGLPKPTFSDKKFLYKQNGFKKTLPYTPGEIELQKQKELYAKEQAQKRKKYKLNVNQLPRSNTPITDHDPDKLNMKQVIRFLQKQKPSGSPRPDTYNVKSPERRSAESPVKTAPANFTVGDKIRSDLKTSDSMRSSRSSEISIASRSKLLSRDSDVQSKTSASPRHNNRYHYSHKHDHSYIENCSTDKRDRHRKSEGNVDTKHRSSHDGRENDRNKHSKKREKEFKLHRFLALAPNGEGQKTNPLIISNISHVRTNNWTTMREGLKSEGAAEIHSKSEEKTCIRRVSSERPNASHYRAMNKENTNINFNQTDKTDVELPQNKTTADKDKYNIGKSATIMHQRTIRFQKVNPRDDMSMPESDDGRISQTNSSMIRLPSVHDFVEEEDEETTTIHDSSKSDIDRRSPTQASDVDSEQKRETNISRISLDSSRSSVYSTPMLSPSHRKGFISKAKQSIHVSLPKEEEETKEVKLSLRQEKDLTAQRSYMHDMVSSRSTDPLEVIYKHTNGHTVSPSSESFYDRNVFRISTVSMQSRKSEDCGICDGTRLSPESHMTSRSIGALSRN